MAAAVLDGCPDAQWRLLFALSRLRCPSEHLALAWADVDWDRGRVRVPSCKTEHLAGGDHRIIPIFPELVPYLRDAFEQADPGTVHVVTRYRHANQNLRTQLLRIMKRAGVDPWPKLFHNLRSSRQTELEEQWPTHVVCAWLGNSPDVARKHYLQVRDAHFDQANGSAACAKAQPAAQSSTESAGVARHGTSEGTLKTPVLPGRADECREVPAVGLTPTGSEHTAELPANRHVGESRSATGGALETRPTAGGADGDDDAADMAELTAAWPRLSPAKRRVVLGIVRGGPRAAGGPS